MLPPPLSVILPPIPPLPPRSLFPSDAAYEAAIQRHAEAVEDRAGLVKDQEATMILFGVCLSLMAVGMIGFAVYVAGGVSAVLGMTALAGIIVLVHRWVRSKL